MEMYYVQDKDGRVGALGADGEPVKRSKEEYPWSYDGFVIWCSGSPSSQKGTNHSIYTDRLHMWDKKKLKKLQLKYFGKESDYWSEFEPDKIEDFLQDWCEDPDLKLERIVQYCNLATGYPLWCLGFTPGDE